ncbi:MAG: TRAP transporter small permease [Pseudomonadota bacterium]
MLDMAAKALETLLEWVVIALMVILTAVVIVAVLFRLAGDSFSWYDEVASILLAWITYYGAALAALKRKHIGFDGALLAIPMPQRRYAAYVAEAVTIGFFALLGWMGLEVILVLGDMGLTSLPWVPVWFTQSVIPIGAVLFILCSLLSFPGYLALISRGVSMEAVEIEHEIAEAEKQFGLAPHDRASQDKKRD